MLFVGLSLLCRLHKSPLLMEIHIVYTYLHFSLSNFFLILLLAPITPFITDTIWRELYSKESIHYQNITNFPEEDNTILETGEKLMEFNKKVWNLKYIVQILFLLLKILLRMPLLLLTPDNVAQKHSI